MSGIGHNGGPAFGHGNPEQGGDPGMSLRDWFAGQALAGLVMLTAATEEEFRPDRIALMAGDIADAMLKARES